MTSNVGARRIGKNVTLGFQRDDEEEQHQRMRERVLEEVKKVFNPEFLNRVDETLVFHRLTKAELLQIVDIQVKEVLDRLAVRGVHLDLADASREFLVRVGSSEEYGARPLRRAVQQYVEDPLAELMLKGELGPGTQLEVQPSETEDKLVFNTRELVAEGVTT